MRMSRLSIYASPVLILLVTDIAHPQAPVEKPPQSRMSAMGQLAHQISSGALAPAADAERVSQVNAAGTQSETSIAVDSTGMHVVVGFNDFRGLSNPALSISGFAYS